MHNREKNMGHNNTVEQQSGSWAAACRRGAFAALLAALAVPVTACAGSLPNVADGAAESVVSAAAADVQGKLPVPMEAASAYPARQLFKQGGMFELYADNRAQGLPNAISADFMALAYSQLRQQRWAALEHDSLMPSYTALLHALRGAAESLDETAPATAHNRALTALLQALNSGNGDALSGDLLSEYQLVQDAQQRVASPLWGWMIDYSQFKPRGRYSDDPALSDYYRSFRYASQLLFAVVPSPGMGVDTAQAQLNAVQAAQMSGLLSSPAIAPLYAQVVDVVAAQFGSGDDLRVQDVVAAVAGQGEAQFSVLLADYAVANGRVPKVLSTAVQGAEGGQDAAQALIGWRLLPAAAPADAAAFQQLVYQGGESLRLDCAHCLRPPKTLGKVAGLQVKAYPSYRELLQLLGSETAWASLTQNHEHNYSGYAQALQRAETALQAAQGMEHQQLALMRHWIAAAATGSSAQQHMADTGAAGFWLWQKYLAQLYQKQSHTGMAKGVNMGGLSARPGATVWPFAQPFAQLAELAMAQVKHDPDGPWQAFAALAKHCAVLATRADSLSAEDEAFLNQLDTALSELGIGADAPIVVDLHSHLAEGQVLSLGLGQPLQWHVGEARGARFNVYEFTVPLSQLLTDTQWRLVLQQTAFSDRGMEGKQP